MTDHILTKHKLKEDIKTFSDIMNSKYVSEDEKKLAMMIYIDKQDYNFIADTLNISVSTVKKRHKDFLKKVSRMIEAGI